MKKLIYVLALTLFMASCIGNNTQSKSDATANSEVSTKADDVTSYKLNDLLSKADSLVEKEVIVIGTVTHTCKHSGRRCFIVGDDQKTSFRIEAKGEIGGFNRELIGSELAIKGTLKEQRLTNEYLDAWEERVNESQGEDGSAETCSAETNNINSMREWMKNNNKDYYSLYFMDGTSFEVVE